MPGKLAIGACDPDGPSATLAAHHGVGCPCVSRPGVPGADPGLTYYPDAAGPLGPRVNVGAWPSGQRLQFNKCSMNGVQGRAQVVLVSRPTRRLHECLDFPGNATEHSDDRGFA